MPTERTPTRTTRPMSSRWPMCSAAATQAPGASAEMAQNRPPFQGAVDSAAAALRRPVGASSFADECMLVPMSGQPWEHPGMSNEPVLRATSESGDVVDDPSEDALFMMFEDMEAGEGNRVGCGKPWLAGLDDVAARLGLSPLAPCRRDHLIRSFRVEGADLARWSVGSAAKGLDRMAARRAPGPGL